ncbi:MAG: hypothetical protein VB106_15715 [Clostridiaceae bacterium]|nr:hypothetical protein [Clostridiaceae bacterium]
MAQPEELEVFAELTVFLVFPASAELDELAAFEELSALVQPGCKQWSRSANFSGRLPDWNR